MIRNGDTTGNIYAPFCTDSACFAEFGSPSRVARNVAGLVYWFWGQKPRQSEGQTRCLIALYRVTLRRLRVVRGNLARQLLGEVCGTLMVARGILTWGAAWRRGGRLPGSRFPLRWFLNGDPRFQSRIAVVAVLDPCVGGGGP